MPRLSREDREDAQAAGVVLGDGGRWHGGLHQHAGGRAGTGRRLRVPADQPSARLSGVRQGRRVPAAGLFLHPRAHQEPLGIPPPHVRRRGCQRRCRLRPHPHAQPQPLHPVHALRPIHARGGRRPADRHHPARLLQPSRHLPRRRRRLAALGQPDGRVPGWRAHDARLPLQVASVGQPQRRRHPLHRLREGLQHHRLDQGQARVGHRFAARTHHAALQSRGERLLDVRHRPLQLPLGGERSAARAASPPAGRRSGPGRRLARRAGRGRPGVEGGRNEPAVPPVGARLARGDVPHRPPRAGTARRRRARRDRRQLDPQREAAARGDQVQGARGGRAEPRRRGGAGPGARRRPRAGSRRAEDGRRLGAGDGRLRAGSGTVGFAG